MGALAAIHTVGAVGASHIERAVASVVTLAVACMRTGVRARGGERSVEGRRRRDRAWRGRRTALLAARVKPSGLARGARAKRMDIIGLSGRRL